MGATGIRSVFQLRAFNQLRRRSNYRLTSTTLKIQVQALQRARMPHRAVTADHWDFSAGFERYRRAMIQIPRDAPGLIACGRSGLPLLAICPAGHRRTVPFRLLKRRSRSDAALRAAVQVQRVRQW